VTGLLVTVSFLLIFVVQIVQRFADLTMPLTHLLPSLWPVEARAIETVAGLLFVSFSVRLTLPTVLVVAVEVEMLGVAVEVGVVGVVPGVVVPPVLAGIWTCAGPIPVGPP
jgi:hypothetical protein